MNRKTIMIAVCCFVFIALEKKAAGQLPNTTIRTDNAAGGNSFASDVNGQPMYQKTEYVTEGSPYLYDEYCLAEITTMEGRVYPGVKIKINLLEKLFVYKNDSDVEMIALTPIKKVKLYSFVNNGVVNNETTLQGFNSAINLPDATVYALLVDSSAKLFKRITVSYTDSKGYGEATVTRVFIKEEAYYALLPGSKELKKVERNKMSVAALFGSKQARVLAYIEKQKLKCRSEQDLIDVFKYYNSN